MTFTPSFNMAHFTVYIYVYIGMEGYLYRVHIGVIPTDSAYDCGTK